MARIIVPLTVKQVKDAKPQEKLYRLYDGNGLQLCIHPSGSKVWRFDYHDHNKKRKTYTIGDANLITLADARIKRDALKLQLINGEAIQTSSNHTYESVFMDWYERWKHGVSERHHTRAMNTMVADVFPKIGNMKIHEIEAKHVVDALLAVEAREALAQLIKTKSFIKLTFDFAVARGLCKYNPVIQVSNQAFKTRKAKQFKSVDQDKIYQFFELFQNENVSLSGRLCTEFIFRNITRPVESATARWDQYDEKLQCIVIEGEDMKIDRNHYIPLSHQSIAILDKMKTLSKGGTYIFPRSNFVDHMSISYPLTLAKRHGIDTTIHGLRHLASTILNETGLFNRDVIESCLAHADENKTRAIYNKAKYIKQKREVLQWWSDFIDKCSTQKGNRAALDELQLILND